VPRLILINGVPASGKSTLARKYAEDHPLTLALDLDVVRAMLGGWLDQPAEAGVMARRIALAMARAHLSAGADIVLPQYLGRLDFVHQLEELCRVVEADFVEIALVSDPAEATARFAQRTANPESPEHLDAAALLQRNGGLAALPQMYDRLLDVIAARPRTLQVETVDGEQELTYQRLLNQLDGVPPQ
jgi:predicted kinase